MTAGKTWGGHAGFDFSSTVPVTIINDMRSTPPRRDSIDVGEDPTLSSALFPGITLLQGSGLDFALGLTSNIDIYFTQNLGIKWQFMGPARGEANPATQEPGEPAKDLGWIGAVFAGPMSESSSSEESSNRSETTRKGAEIGLSFGKRFDESQMVYFTFASRGGTADIVLTQSNGTKYTYADKYDHYIATLGYLAGKAWYFKGELSADYINWSGRSDSLNKDISGSATKAGFTLGFGYQW